jgi:hypothetical protein
MKGFPFHVFRVRLFDIFDSLSKVDGSLTTAYGLDSCGFDMLDLGHCTIAFFVFEFRFSDFICEHRKYVLIIIYINLKIILFMME